VGPCYLYHMVWLWVSSGTSVCGTVMLTKIAETVNNDQHNELVRDVSLMFLWNPGMAPCNNL